MFSIVLLVSYALWHIINAVIVNGIFFFNTGFSFIPSVLSGEVL